MLNNSRVPLPDPLWPKNPCMLRQMWDGQRLSTGKCSHPGKCSLRPVIERASIPYLHINYLISDLFIYRHFAMKFIYQVSLNFDLHLFAFIQMQILIWLEDLILILSPDCYTHLHSPYEISVLNL